ncbi:MAG: signal peptidase II [Bacilli bacterium]|nr:signal peptidase II [Bacilli bacterium]
MSENGAKKKELTPEQKKIAFRDTVIFAAMAVLLFIIDIVSKWIVQSTCVPGEQHAIIPNFLYVTLSYNTGVAFGLGDNLRWLNIIISIVMSAGLIFYYVYAWKDLKRFMKAVIALLIAGAVGNMIDRCFYWNATTGFNGVIDFIQFYLAGGPGAKTNVINPFATFNIADSCLVIGIIMFLIAMVIDWIKNPHNEDLSKDPRHKESVRDEQPTRQKGVEAKERDEAYYQEHPEDRPQ